MRNLLNYASIEVSFNYTAEYLLISIKALVLNSFCLGELKIENLFSMSL